MQQDPTTTPTTSEDVIHAPVSAECEKLRQAIMASPEFEAWMQFVRNERQTLTLAIAYDQFIEIEYQNHHPQPPQT